MSCGVASWLTRRNSDPDTVALRNLNDASARDPRFDLSMVPIGDGLTLLRKRP